VKNPTLDWRVPWSLPETRGTVWCAGISRSRLDGSDPLHPGGRVDHAGSYRRWPTDDMPDAFAIPRDVLDKIGGFDEERFPIHYDEADLNARIR
jgi:GT2 family glycosyltransferase